MKTTNLLPKEDQKEITLEFVFDQMLFFWICVVGSLVIFWILGFAGKIYLNQKINTTVDEIAKQQNVLNSSDYKDLQRQVLELNGTIKEINNLQSQHYYWSKAISELSSLVPADVQLNQIIISRETGRIDITGQAKTRDSVIELWSNIIKSDYFRGINFPLANLEKSKLGNFTYTFYVKKEKIKTP